MNKVVLIGNITKEVEFAKTNSGISMAKFTIAVNRKSANETSSQATDFINCTAWRKQADNLNKYCKKGDKISVVGSLQINSYDAHDGSKRYYTEVIVDEIEFISTKKSENNEDQYKNNNNFNSSYDDDLPF